MGVSYPREIIAEVLHQTDIRDIISARIELQPGGGSRHKALCPFHGEKTPSFIVDTQRQTFKCFGCGQGGDAITFVMEYDGLNFVEALQVLAERAGVSLPEQSSGNRDDDLRPKIAELNGFAAKFFREELAHPMKGGEARNYLKTRSLKPETEERFGIGFAENDYESLWKAAAKAGFKEFILTASGLAKERDRGGIYDFFRGRLMVPIRDMRGRVIAFGGRDLTGESPAKYINTPENALYKKSQVLYGLYEARDAMRESKQAIMVEGYFDAMRCADAGIGYAVATCGTALTQQQARLLRRYVPEVVLVYDGDAAGLQAASRGIGVLIAEDLSVRVLALPEGSDPDDFIREHGAEKFLEFVKSAPDFVRFYIQAQSDRLGTAEGRTKVARELLAVIGMIDDAIRRDEYVKLAAEELKVDPWTLRREFESQNDSQRSRYEAAKKKPDNVVTFRPVAQSQHDVVFIAALLDHTALLELAREALSEIHLAESPLTEVLTAAFAGVDASTMRRCESEEAQSLYAAASAFESASEPEAREIVKKRLNRLRNERTQADLADIQEAIRRAEAEGDREETRRLAQRQMELTRQLHASGAI